MDRSRSYRCVVAAVVSITMAACGEGALPAPSGQPGQPGASGLSGSFGAPIIPSGGAQSDKDGALAGMFVCDVDVPASTQMSALAHDLEVDRVYHADRPGFIRQWTAAGPRASGGRWGALVTKFHSPSQAQEFSTWLADDYVLHGTRYWDRPYFKQGVSCNVWEVLASVERPSTEATQVAIRFERFPLFGATRAELRAWFAGVRVEALRRGHSSIALLFSEDLRMASLVYFADVPRAQRGLGNPNPLAARQPFVQDDVFDQSGWTLAIWFPFETGDHGRPALWPLPGIEAFPGDGVCSVSRHETVHTTSDCLATCGNGAEDQGETEDNCPGDVRLFD